MVTWPSQGLAASNFDHISPTKDRSSCPSLISKTLVDFHSKIKLYSIFTYMLSKDYRNSYHFQRLKREARLCTGFAAGTKRITKKDRGYMKSHEWFGRKEHFLRGKLQTDSHFIVINFRSWTLQETLALYFCAYLIISKHLRHLQKKRSEPLKDHWTNNSWFMAYRRRKITRLNLELFKDRVG